MSATVGAFVGAAVSLIGALETACTACTLRPGATLRPPMVATAPGSVAVTLTTFVNDINPPVHPSSYRVRFASCSEPVGMYSAILPRLSDSPSKTP